MGEAAHGGRTWSTIRSKSPPHFHQPEPPASEMELRQRLTAELDALVSSGSLRYSGWERDVQAARTAMGSDLCRLDKIKARSDKWHKEKARKQQHRRRNQSSAGTSAGAVGAPPTLPQAPAPAPEAPQAASVRGVSEDAPKDSTFALEPTLADFLRAREPEVVAAFIRHEMTWANVKRCDLDTLKGLGMTKIGAMFDLKDMADTRKHRGKLRKGQEADDSTTLATFPVAPAVETNLQVNVPGPDAPLVSAGHRKSPAHEMRDKQQALRRELRQASAAKGKARKALNLTKKGLQHVNPADKRNGAARARRSDKLQQRLAAIAAKVANGDCGSASSSDPLPQTRACKFFLTPTDLDRVGRTGSQDVCGVPISCKFGTSCPRLHTPAVSVHNCDRLIRKRRRQSREAAGLPAGRKKARVTPDQEHFGVLHDFNSDNGCGRITPNQKAPGSGRAKRKGQLHFHKSAWHGDRKYFPTTRSDRVPVRFKRIPDNRHPQGKWKAIAVSALGPPRTRKDVRAKKKQAKKEAALRRRQQRN